jgi:hypothetical protein
VLTTYTHLSNIKNSAFRPSCSFITNFEINNDYFFSQYYSIVFCDIGMNYYMLFRWRYAFEVLKRPWFFELLNIWCAIWIKAIYKLSSICCNSKCFWLKVCHFNLRYNIQYASDKNTNSTKWYHFHFNYSKFYHQISPKFHTGLGPTKPSLQWESNPFPGNKAAGAFD